MELVYAWINIKDNVNGFILTDNIDFSGKLLQSEVNMKSNVTKYSDQG